MDLLGKVRIEKKIKRDWQSTELVNKNAKSIIVVSIYEIERNRLAINLQIDYRVMEKRVLRMTVVKYVSINVTS